MVCLKQKIAEQGEKRLRDVWEKIKEQNVSGGINCNWASKYTYFLKLLNVAPCVNHHITWVPGLAKGCRCYVIKCPFDLNENSSCTQRRGCVVSLI